MRRRYRNEHIICKWNRKFSLNTTHRPLPTRRKANRPRRFARPENSSSNPTGPTTNLSLNTRQFFATTLQTFFVTHIARDIFRRHTSHTSLAKFLDVTPFARFCDTFVILPISCAEWAIRKSRGIRGTWSSRDHERERDKMAAPKLQDTLREDTLALYSIVACRERSGRMSSEPTSALCLSPWTLDASRALGGLMSEQRRRSRRLENSLPGGRYCLGPSIRGIDD